MLLYFTNNSKQNKILIETEYAEDVYDEIMAFFEEHGIRPHFVKISMIDRNSYSYIGEKYHQAFEPVCKISFGSFCGLAVFVYLCCAKMVHCKLL